MTLSKGNLNLPLLLFKQVFFGLAVGYIFARVSRYIIRKVNNIDSGMSMALITALCFYPIQRVNLLEEMGI